MRAVRRSVIVLGIGLLATGCLLLRDVDALDARNGASGTSAGEGGSPPPPDASTAIDAPGDCPGMVRVTTYCIDPTEVTVGQYREFARTASTAGQRADCSWNTSFVPDDPTILEGEQNLPVSFVDFCDALAYCDRAGKRLCGKIDGGPTPFADFASPAVSQWSRACTHDGENVVPYGSYSPDTCNGVDNEEGGPWPVGSHPACSGGYPGIFDLSGNVREWEDACEPGTGTDRSCLARGGAFYDIDSTLFCDNRQPMAVTLQNPGLGFRCCSR